ncbi:MAG: MFS transporter [Pseudomonadota bacterium]
MPGILALGLAYVFSQFYRACLAVLAPYLTADLGLDAADLGRASGAWFLTFALMQLPVGVGLDRIGPRLTGAVLFGLGAGGGAALFAVAQGPVTVTAAFILMGAGCAPALMAVMFIFARRYPPAKFATLAALTVGIGTLGNIAGTEPFALLIEAIGWRAAMAAIAVASAAVAVSALILVRDPPRLEPESGARDRGFLDFAEIIRLRALWPILPLAAINYAPAAGIRGLWAGPYLGEVFALTPPEIGRATLWIAVAMSAGAFAYGPLDRIFGTRKWVIVPGNLAVTAGCLALALLTAASAPLSIALMTAIGALGATYTVVMAHARALFPARLVGRGVTFLNLFVMGGVGFAQWLTGEVVQLAGDASGPAEAYQLLFALYAGLMAAALAIYLFSRDAKP